MLKISRQNLMVLVLSVLLVIGGVLTGGCAPGKIATPATPRPAAAPPPVSITQNITPQAANTLIQGNKSNTDFIILDVRTPEEFADGHIENAVNLDFYLATFREELDKLDKNKIYLVYCRSGSRSFNAARMMETLRFKKVYNMLDGLIRWKSEALPLVK